MLSVVAQQTTHDYEYTYHDIYHTISILYLLDTLHIVNHTFMLCNAALYIISNTNMILWKATTTSHNLLTSTAWHVVLICTAILCL